MCSRCKYSANTWTLAQYPLFPDGTGRAAGRGAVSLLGGYVVAVSGRKDLTNELICLFFFLSAHPCPLNKAGPAVPRSTQCFGIWLSCLCREAIEEGRCRNVSHKRVLGCCASLCQHRAVLLREEGARVYVLLEQLYSDGTHVPYSSLIF